MSDSKKSLTQSASDSFLRIGRSRKYYESPAGKWILRAVKKYGPKKSDREIVEIALREQPDIFGKLYIESTRRNISQTRRMLNIANANSNAMTDADRKIIASFIQRASPYDSDRVIARLILISGKIDRQVKLDTLRRRVCYIRAEMEPRQSRTARMERLQKFVKQVCDEYPKENIQFKSSRLQLLAGISDSYAFRLCSRYSKFKKI